MMRAVTIAVVFFVLCAARAAAVAEFCPAQVSLRPVGDGFTPAQVYGFELSAEGSRTVTSMLAFDTSAGWFTASVPAVEIAEKDRHYTAPWVSFTRRDWVSPVMYLRFPGVLTVKRTWVYLARATGDSFGWEAKGQVSCSANPGPAIPPRLPARPPTLDPRDDDHLNASPRLNASFIPVVASLPLKQTNCGKPFEDASVATMIPPNFPEGGPFPGSSVDAGVETTVAVTVIINANGSLSDAWIWESSGVPNFDRAALNAARATGYRPALAYCEAVPSQYLFKVTFTPN